jgi:3-deoxy-D-manno-octulosonic-acid transferase
MLLFFSKIIYQISVNAYHFFIGAISLFNQKAYKFTEGRINQTIASSAEKTIWFHCASLGEFEQAKPLITWCYNNLSEPIILTFFSPSGYTYKNNYPLARAVYYLPIDQASQAKEFIDQINPSLVFFIKYEFWYFYLNELKQQQIPHYLVAGIFRKEQLFFRPIGALHSAMLASFDHVFVQDEASLKLLQEHNFTNSSLAFDPRFDTVKHTSTQNFQNEIIEEFIGNKKCFIVGSSWPKDEQLIYRCLPELADYKIIIAPHNINHQRVKQVNKLFTSSTLLSNPIDLISSKVLIIDSIGKLSSLYRYANLCYVGGGFGMSVHNVLEAAVYGNALIFGPNHSKSKEANDLLELGAAFEVRNDADFKQVLSHYTDENALNLSKLLSKEYVENRLGGTETVMIKLLKDGIIKTRKTL